MKLLILVVSVCALLVSCWPSTPPVNGYGSYVKKNLFGGKYWVYVGNFKNGKRHGHGTFIQPNPNHYGNRDGTYVGQWKNNMRHGRGTHFPKNWSTPLYVGDWLAGKKHGQGTETHRDGRKYVGEWKDNAKHGRSTYTWPNGAKYVGEWRDGKEYGQATYTWPSGRAYVGEWKDVERKIRDARLVQEGITYGPKFGPLRYTPYKSGKNN